jgi:vancomycin resistance protein VanW
MNLLNQGKRTARELRRELRYARRVIDDARDDILDDLVGPDAAAPTRAFEPRLTSIQPVRKSAGATEKRHNIRLAASRIEPCVIAPGALWSFWHLVGRPAPSRGFQAGRSIVDGRVVRDYGGGLCQLAGLIHLASLRAGLGIVESHPHSRDLYDETSRYAPLGSDAAVAFAYKDLRVRNTLDQPVGWQIEVAKEHVAVSLLAPQPVEEHQVRFVRHDARTQRLAVTYRRCKVTGRRELTRISHYNIE